MTIIFGHYNLGKDQVKNVDNLFISKDCVIERYVDNHIYFKSSVMKKYHIASRESIVHDSLTKITILADARIFNRNELLNYFFDVNKTTFYYSDSYLILRAYQRWGEQCVEKIIGDFCFAIYDENKELIFFASDPVGQRCLFYSKISDNIFCFANLPKALFDVYGISKKLNNNKIADFLTLITANSAHTFFNEIKRIPPGHTLTLNKHSCTPILNCYWSAKSIVTEKQFLSSEKEYYEQFRELYQKIISEQLSLSTNNIGCHLSGGLDSSSVVSIAATLLKNSNKLLTAFCHVPTPQNNHQPIAGWNYDDSQYMEAIKNKYKDISLVYIQDDHKKLFEYSKVLNPWIDMPTLSPSNVLWLMMIVEQAQLLNIKTILTGQGGNFTLSWEGPMPVVNHEVSFLRKIKRKIMSYEQHLFKWSLGQRKDKPWSYFSAISDSLAKESNLTKRFSTNSLAEYQNHTGDHRVLVFDGGLMGTMATIYTAIRHLYDIEHWDPTVDRRMIEFCLRTPDYIFQKEGRSRLLVRESLRDFIPPIISERTTRGMQAADWYKKIDRQKNQIYQQLIAWQATAIADYLDIDALLQQFSEWKYQDVLISKNKEYKYFEMKYHIKLIRAIEVGFFIQAHLSKS